jgi:hypothetical protein
MRTTTAGVARSSESGTMTRKVSAAREEKWKNQGRDVLGLEASDLWPETALEVVLFSPV